MNINCDWKLLCNSLSCALVSMALAISHYHVLCFLLLGQCQSTHKYRCDLSFLRRRHPSSWKPLQSWDAIPRWSRLHQYAIHVPLGTENYYLSPNFITKLIVCWFLCMCFWKCFWMQWINGTNHPTLTRIPGEMPFILEKVACFQGIESPEMRLWWK